VKPSSLPDYIQSEYDPALYWIELKLHLRNQNPLYRLLMPKGM